MDHENEDLSLSYQTVKMFIEYKLIREFVSFQKQNLSHIYIIPSCESAFRWNGVMFIHHGFYTDSILKFTVKIPEDYPNSECPKIIFNPIPYHPLIDPHTGELNTKREFATWQPNINKIWHVILFAKKIFYLLDKVISEKNSDDEKTAINDPLVNPQQQIAVEQTSDDQIDLGSHYNETMQLFHTNLEDYLAKVDESIKECHARLYDNPEENNLDLHAIKFGPWNPSSHETLRKKLLKGIDLVEEFNNLTILNGPDDDFNPTSTPARTNGLSFMMKGQIFSKPDA